MADRQLIPLQTQIIDGNGMMTPRWRAFFDGTAKQVQSVAEGEGIDDAVIPATSLQDQLQFEISLISEVDTVFGSVAQFNEDRLTESQRAAEATISEMITRRNKTTQQSASVTETVQVLEGVKAQWAVSVNVDNQVEGLVKLSADDSESNFTVVADTFQVAKPGDAAGSAVPVFVIGTVDGNDKVALRGDMIVDGDITASKLSVSELSAIVADIGTITAGVLKSSDDKMVIDLDNKELVIES